MHTDDLLTILIRNTPKENLLWAMNVKLIKSTVYCGCCACFMSLKPTKDAIDSFEWRCIAKHCAKYKHTKSVRTDSFLQNFKLPLVTIIKSLIQWTTSVTEVAALKNVKISRVGYRSIRTKLTEKITQYFLIHPIKLGGPLSIVHIDETKLDFNVKNHRGRGPRELCWAICIVDTQYTPALGYSCLVNDRSARTLIPIIENVVNPNSTIYTDEWAAYHSLSTNTNYEFATVCHKYHFVCPVTGVHTQNVESYNNKLKYQIKMMKGLTFDARRNFLIDFMWKERHTNNV